VAYRPSKKRKSPPRAIQPNITPVMNLVVVLIPMLLAVAQFVQVGLIDYQPPPAESLQSEGRIAADGRERLELVVNVLPDGFEVSLFGATRGRNFTVIGLTERGEHDFEALHRELLRIRLDVIGAPIDTVFDIDPASGRSVPVPRYRYPDAEVVNVSARGDTPWQVVVSVMDAARSYIDERGRRQPLFALPRLGQIQ
jgi:biopolymer transport protein ExbD